MRQSKLLTKLLVGTGLVLNVASANALTSTFTFSNPAIVGTSGSLAVGGLFPSGNIATFNSGTLDFYFSASNSTPSYAGSSTTGWNYNGSSSYQSGGYWSCYAFGGCYFNPTYSTNYYYSNTRTNFYSSSGQSATVSAGGNSVTAAAPSSTSTISNGSSTTSSWNGAGYNYFTTQYLDNTTITGGSFNAMLGLDMLALAGLNNSGLINFTFQSVGNVTLNQIVLTADYSLNPSMPVASVPEPETYAMLLAGLVLLGLTLRRRKKITP